jgi:hypothetical protein
MLFSKNSDNLFLAEPALSSWSISSLITHSSARVQMWQSLAGEWDGCAGAWFSGACALVADSAIRRGLPLHSS